ncbi:MAG TPA: hypothetical protein VGN99_05440 [Steroidobacteraceae bacterium]|nr:hypothetical protein [Steroidobacteraceae bacterium]
MRRPFLFAVVSIAAAFWGLALALAWIDPFAVYSWGPGPRLKSGDEYSMRSKPYLVDAVAKSADIDTIFVGGSTGHFYTAQMMQEILPGTIRAFNLSYSGPAHPDREVVQRLLLEHSHAHRFILEASWNYMVPKQTQVVSTAFPIYLYDNVWWNDLRAVNWETIKLSVALLRSKPLWIDAWAPAREYEGYRRRYDVLHGQDAIADFKGYISRNKASIDTPSKLTCESMDALGDGLVPFVRALAKRGAEVDVLLPAYSWFMYYWTSETDKRMLSRPSLLNDLLVMRHCLVHTLDGLPGVRIFAFDDVPGLASDMRNYFDPGHLYNPEANRYVLQSIVRNEHRLTRDNVEARNAAMRLDVIQYEFTNEKVWATPP